MSVKRTVNYLGINYFQHRLQVEKRVFTEYFNRERILASALEEEADRIAQEWKRDAENKADEFARHIEAEKRIDKEVSKPFFLWRK